MVMNVENRNLWIKDKPLAKDRRSFKGNCFQKIAFGLPPMISTKEAAAMPEAEPHSA